MSTKIAKVALEPETSKIAKITFFRKDLKFKCKRCAVFCCKLGGPEVGEKDVSRFEQAGYDVTDFTYTKTNQTGIQKDGGLRVLKQKEDGSCIFLQHNGENEAYECSVYDLRPTLCRLYPFEFKPTDENTGTLGVIPCCNGLNAPDGFLVDQKFIEERLLEAMLNLL